MAKGGTRRIRRKGGRPDDAPSEPIQAPAVAVEPEQEAQTDVGTSGLTGLTRPVGRTIGRYRVCFEIASGGMATVYLASLRGAAGFNKVVALKCIHPHLAGDPKFVEMFLDEARIASRINHGNVCQIFDFGEADGSQYLAMEYLVGEPLSSVLERVGYGEGSTDTPRYRALVARVLSDACEGLHAVHETTDPHGKALEVVHRDVSPQNVFLTFDGITKVVDFGIARAKHKLHRTEAGEIKGNLPYVAPEQIRGPAVDRRADVWSVGVILWEALTGRSLFAKESSLETIFAVLDEEIPRVDAVRPGIPRIWADLVESTLQRDRDARPPTARDLSRALQEAVRTETQWPTQTELSEWVETLFPRGRRRHQERLRLTSEAADSLFDEAAEPTTRRRRWPLWLASAAVVALAVGGVVYSGVLGPEATPPEPALIRAEPRAGTEAAPRSVAEPEAQPPESEAESEEPAPAQGIALDPIIVESSDDDRRRQREEARRRAARAAMTAMADAPPDDPAAPGTVNIVVPDGWGIVFLRGRRLGQTPLRTTLPAGTHVLEVRPFGRTPSKRVRVDVPAGGTARASVRVGG